MRTRLALLASGILCVAATAHAHWPYGIVAGDDGDVFFLRWPEKEVIRVAGDGEWSVLADLSEVAGDAYPHAIARGPDGALYVAATYAPEMWRIGPDGAVSAHSPAPDDITLPAGDWLNLAFGPEGRMHLVLADVERDGDGRTVDVRYRIVRLGKDGAVAELWAAQEGDEDFLPLYGSCLCVTGDRRVWLTNGGRLLRLGKGGKAEVVVAEGLGNPWTVVPHPDGGVLVLDEAGGRVLRVGAEGEVAEVVTGLERAWSLARGRDGDLLVAEEPEPGSYRIRRFVAGNGLETVATVKSD